MSHIFAGAFPVLPGKSQRVRDFEKELAPHRAEWDRLSIDGTFRFYNVTLQPGQDGDIAIYTFEIEDATKLRMTFGDSPHDTWWKEYFLDVHGIELTPGGRGSVPPETVFTWWST